METTGAAAEVDGQGLEMRRRDAYQAPWGVFSFFFLLNNFLQLDKTTYTEWWEWPAPLTIAQQQQQQQQQQQWQ